MRGEHYGVLPLFLAPNSVLDFYKGINIHIPIEQIFAK